MAIQDSRQRYIHPPTAVVWSTPGQGRIEHAQAILSQDKSACVLSGGGPTDPPGLIVDFGCELNGGVAIEVVGTAPTKHATLRVRFGESVSEVMHQPDGDHAIHDFVLDFPCRCIEEIGNTGFRFVRIDLVDEKNSASIRSVKAVSLARSMKQVGHFECSDPELNQIWQTGVRTVELCCQDYILDGIKRDRMVWMGDIHPQIHVIASVFGDQDIVPDSMRYLAQEYAPDQWMNRICSYSLWWIVSQLDWYYYTGQSDLIRQQQDYLRDQVRFLAEHVDADGQEKLGGNRFLDWAIKDQPEAVADGLQSLFLMAMRAAAELFTIVADASMADYCRELASRLERGINHKSRVKQVNALNVLTGQSTDWVSLYDQGPVSPWFAYYSLQAGGITGRVPECLKFIKAYWGGMLKLGATSFWEHFDLEWLEQNPSRIDAVCADGQRDIHAEFGEHCYRGLRHSLCHGWSGGPSAWLMQSVLGIHSLEPGYGKLSIRPALGHLEWANGSFPTAQGVLHVQHKRNRDQIITEYDCDGTITVLTENDRPSHIPHTHHCLSANTEHNAITSP